MSTTNKPTLNPNFYELLEVSMGADEEEIRRAYDRIKHIYSEDSLAIYGLYTAEEIRDFREQVEQAFRVLIDSENRRDYDRGLIAKPVDKASHREYSVRPRQNAAQGEPESQNDDTDPDSFANSAYNENNDSESPVNADSGSRPENDRVTRRNVDVPEDIVFSGEVLRELRESNGIDLRDVSETTKVSITNLRLLEAEEWTKLPAMVYVKGFITQYANYMGLNAARVKADLLARFDKSRDYDRD